MAYNLGLEGVEWLRNSDRKGNGICKGKLIFKGIYP